MAHQERIAKKHNEILSDIKKIFIADIDDWSHLAGALKGFLETYGYKMQPGWFDKEIVVEFPDPEFEVEQYLELGEYLNEGLSPRWDQKFIWYLQYLEKINY